jgi:zeta-carotene desaturase
MQCLSLSEKIALGRALLTLKKERLTRTDLDQITMRQWLNEKRQPARVIQRFWEPVLVSAINEDLDRMAATHGFQVFWLGFLAKSDGYEMGVPSVPLATLYGSDVWKRFANINLHLRSAVTHLDGAGVTVGGETRTADYYVSSLPFERVAAVAPDLPAPAFEHSPITGIHLWFDRRVVDLPHAVLLDRTIQWLFNKEDGRHVQLVVSASRRLTEMSRNDVIAMALAELGEFFPAVKSANLEKAHVVKEIRATFSATPGLESLRPGNRTRLGNVFLAGDWTRSGWPATMEGAVRSGYLAAEAVTEAARDPRKFLLPDIA